MTHPIDPWHPRNLRGYGPTPSHLHWPNGNRLALQFVLNIEEGAEQSILNGDPGSEYYLSEIPNAVSIQGLRHYSSESHFDFGSRVGIWRILRLFAQHQLPLTAFACGRALELNPEIAPTLIEQRHEIAGHGYRWIDYRYLDEEVERDHIHRTQALIQQACGTAPIGWYTGRVSPNTRRLLVETGNILYDSDAYDDELPYWLSDQRQAHLVIPYSLITNDIRYVIAPGCSNANDFFNLLRDTFDQLWLEGETLPRLMNIGLHPRFSGHAGRIGALARFMDYVAGFDGVWICRRRDIAEHWLNTFPASSIDFNH